MFDELTKAAIEKLAKVLTPEKVLAEYDRIAESDAECVAELPPVAWDAALRAILGREPTDDYAQHCDLRLNALAKALSHRAVAAVRLAAYFNARAAARPHDEAAQDSSRHAVATAKACGFTYPGQHRLTF